ncbi:hypothetical protein [Dethiosulfatarculus sandiegensis]|uniref:DUF4064 domain-containing protein n=1 Tax=Dethiosulfatarculus sandiegensis TaxID=1429043 RepID=A0A0D2HX76_9BACT|nr:hypothetical protein [Dethiosulfatarculus sandiegensis]KIX14963.1 hypothetical protein X474_05555 [Dethiosulfatarculus sandiegensis]
MQKVGGILALISGVLGVLAAMITFSFNELSGTFEAGGGNQMLGLSELVFALLTIVFGGLAMGANSKKPGIILIICSILGIIVGGHLMVMPMVFALISGVFAAIGVPKKATASTKIQPQITRTNGRPRCR